MKKVEELIDSLAEAMQEYLSDGDIQDAKNYAEIIKILAS